MNNNKTLFKRIVSAALCFAMVLTYVDMSPVRELTGAIINAMAADPELEDEDTKRDNRPILNPDSNRVYLTWTQGVGEEFGGVRKKNAIHVYAKAGETISFGSSVYNAGYDLSGNTYRGYDDKDSVDIVMKDVNNREKVFDITENGKGHINSFELEETAKLAPELKNGKLTYIDTSVEPNKTYEYTPMTYVAPETGVYTFEFRSKHLGPTAKGNPNYGTGSYNFKNSDKAGFENNGCLIAAWDVSVFNEKGQREVGRTYTDYLSVQVGDNHTPTVNERYWIVTNDSYIYRMDFNDCSPYTYAFFANNRGLYDTATESTVYKSVKLIDNGSQYASTYDSHFGVTYKYPGTDPDDLNRSYYIFFDYPDVDDLTGQLFDKPMLPDPAENLTFDGMVEDDGKIVPGTYEGMGGYFSFDVKQASTASIIIRFIDENGKDKFAPVELSGPVKPYSHNRLYWNGRDGDGKVIPKGIYDSMNISYEVITKSGEIHFPIADMEFARKGITFTRVNELYNSDGTLLNDEDFPIYDATKSIIYYDDSAIYYGEKVASTGTKTEKDAHFIQRCLSGAITDKECKDVNGETYYAYNNATKNWGPNSEYSLYYKNDTEFSDYINKHKLKVGDHSHTSNVIDYTKDVDSQKDVIAYLNSARDGGYGVGVSSTDGCSTSGGDTTQKETTTDHAIANFYTFIPHVSTFPVNAGTLELHILKPDENAFNFIGRVYYDNFDKSNTASGASDRFDSARDTLLKDVEVRLYKKTTDTKVDPSKKYYEYKSGNTYDNKMVVVESPSAAYLTGLYELVDTGKTTARGEHVFTDVKYDKDKGTEFLYYVIRPDKDYGEPCTVLKTGAYGAFNNLYENINRTGKNVYGTEIQQFKVGGTDGINIAEIPTTKTANMLAAADVGYQYTKMDYTIDLKKIWKNGDAETHPEAVFYELSYSTLDNSGSVKQEGLFYGIYAVSGTEAWINNHDLNLLPKKISDEDVYEYYVSAEYYFYNGVLFRHEFPHTKEKGYTSFQGDSKYYKPAVDKKTYLTSLSDITIDGVKLEDPNDLKKINDKDWETYTAAISMTRPAYEKNGVKYDETEVKAQAYTAVVDHNIVAGKPKVEINVTNSFVTNPATIEVYKYYEETADVKTPLRGATFRLYEGDVDAAKEKVQNNEPYVDVGTTRSNGVYAFTGLDAGKTYTLYELFPPSGFRAIENYYEVKPENFDTKTKYCRIEIPNAISENGFAIRKTISGRSWEDSDKFDFEITMPDENYYDGVGSEAENEIIKKDPNTAAGEFKATFNSTHKTVNINNDNKYYTYIADETERVSADTKVTKNLLINCDNTNEVGPYDDATFNGLAFPAAGTYTFDIKETEGADKVENLEYSKTKYRVTFKVERIQNFSEWVDDAEGTKVPNTDIDSTLRNSHLEASLSSIAIVDEAGNARTVNISSPVFINTYIIRSTTENANYSIKKELTGRDWVESDSFDFTITYGDEPTKLALQNGNFIVRSKNGSAKELLLGKENVVDPDIGITTAKKTISSKEDVINISEFDYKDIQFPVKYVYPDGTVWEGDGDNPTQEEINDNKLVPKTEPVEYSLLITENIPEDKKEIKYDETEYTLKILLYDNVGEGEGAGGGDGHIDEVQLFLYKNYEGEKSTPQAECKVYPNETGADKHASIDSHVMKFTNKYDTSVRWYPIVEKSLIGRDWDTNDSFKFTIECTKYPGTADDKGVQMSADGKLEIYVTGSEETYTDEEGKEVPNTRAATFGRAVFTRPGKYTFKVTETSGHSGSSLENMGFETPAEQYFYVEAKLNEKTGKLEFYKYTNSDFEGEGKEIALDGEGSGYIRNTFAFTNSYTDKHKNEYPFSIKKILKGRSWAETDSFTFKLTPGDEATTNAIGTGKYIELPTKYWTEKDGSYTTTVNSKDPKEVFINFLKLDEANDFKEYTFTLSEVKVPESDNMDYSTEEYTLTFTVSRARELDSEGAGTYLNGYLAVSVEVRKEGKTPSTTYYTADTPSLEFTNEAYVTNSEFKIEKSLFGTWFDDREFTANVTLDKIEPNGSESLTGNEKVTITKEDGTVVEIGTEKTVQISISKNTDPVSSVIPDIKFYAPATYTFTVSEADLPPMDETIKKDDRSYTVTAIVKDNGGSLGVNYSYEVDGESADTVKFENVSVGSLSVKKEISTNKKDGEIPGIKGKKFHFTVTLTIPEKDKEEETLPEWYDRYTISGDDTVIKTKLEDGRIQITFDLEQGETATIGNLPVGTAYTVTEAEEFGFETAMTEGGKGTIQDSEESITGTISSDENRFKTVTVTNTYNVKDIKIIKQVIDESNTELPGDETKFNFTITLTDDKGGQLNSEIYDGISDIAWEDKTGTFVLSAGGSIDLKNIPYGAIYTITETGMYAGYKNDDKAERTGTVGKDSENEITFKNTKLTETTLKITKTVKSDIKSDSDIPFKFTVTLTAPDGTIFTDMDKYDVVGGVTWTTDNNKLKEGNFSLTDSQSITIKGLPNGTKYEVTEKVTETENSLFDTSYKITGAGEATPDTAVSGSSIKEKSLSAVPTSVETNVEFINTRKTGKLTISKTVKRADGVKDKKSFDFTISIPGINAGTYDGVEFDEDGNAAVDLTDGGSITIEGLLLGAGYTVTEDNVKAEGYIIKSEGNKGNITTDSVAKFTNIYDAKPEKTLEDCDPKNVKVGDVLTYAITWYNNSEDKAEITITDTLPMGLTFVECENDSSGVTGNKEDVKGKCVGDTVTWIFTAEGLASGTVKVTVRVNEDAVGEGAIINTANVTNSKLPGSPADSNDVTVSAVKTGSLTIYKNVVGSAAERDKFFKFTISARDSGGNPLRKKYSGVDFSSGGATISLKDGGSYTISGLPEGAVITVTETYDSAKDYTTKVNGEKTRSADITITAGKNAEAEFVNTKEGENKKIVKDMPAGGMVNVGDMVTYEITWNNNEPSEANVTVTDILPEGLKYVSGKNDDDTEGSYNEETRTVTWDLGSRAAGTSGTITLVVEVTEAAVKWDGLNTATIAVTVGSETKTSEAASDKQLTVRTGDVNITKTVINNMGEKLYPEQTFTFTITASTTSEGAAIPLEEAYDTLTVTDGKTGSESGKIDFNKDGKATITLKASQTMTIKGLPTGADLSISEEIAPGYVFKMVAPPEKPDPEEDSTGGLAEDPAEDPTEFKCEVPYMGPAVIEYTNEKLAEHDLTISKTVAGLNGETERPWNFDVLLTAPTGTKLAESYVVTGDASVTWSTEADGTLKGQFRITDSQGIIIKGLPDGTIYNVIENDIPGNYHISAIIIKNKTKTEKIINNDTGSEGTKAAQLWETGDPLVYDTDVEFTNQSPVPVKDEGSYQLTKEVTGVKADTDSVWHFDVEFTNEGDPLSGQYSYIRRVGTSERVTSEHGIITVKDGRIVAVDNPDSTAVVKTEGSAYYCFALKDQETIRIYRLPAGAVVTVSEREGNQDGYKTTFNDPEMSGKLTGDRYSISIPDQKTSIVTCTNERQTGTLDVLCNVVDENNVEVDDDTEFSFDVQFLDENGDPLDPTFYEKYADLVEWDTVNGKGTFKWKKGDPFIFEGLPHGTQYSISEHKYAGYTTDPNVYSGSISGGPEPAEVEFRNMKLDISSLRITKEVVSDIEADKEKVFAIGVKLTAPDDTILADSYTYTIGGEVKGILTKWTTDGTVRGSVILKDGQEGVIEGLPRDTAVTVSEWSAQQPGSLFTPSFSSESTVLAAGDGNSIVVTNTRKQATLSITKTISSAADLNETDKIVPFDFSIELYQPDGTPLTGSYDVTVNGKTEQVVFTDGKAAIQLCDGQTAVIEGLPIGAMYKVSETSGYAGYVPEPDSKDKEGEIALDGSAAEVKFVNIKKTGSLTISKSVENSDGSELSKTEQERKFGFDVTLSIGDVKPASVNIEGQTEPLESVGDGVFYVELADGESITLTGLPQGTTYKVEEHDYSDKGYGVPAIDGGTASDSFKTGSIGDVPETVVFTNTRNVGSIRVTNTVRVSGSSSDTELSETDRTIPFGFDIRLLYGAAVPAVAAMSESDPDSYPAYVGEISDGAAPNAEALFDSTGAFAGIVYNDGTNADELVLAHNTEITIYGIPGGMNYEVEETRSNGYSVSAGSGGVYEEKSLISDAVVAINAKSEADFINTRYIGDINVTKTVENANIDDEGKLFSIDVYFEDDEGKPAEGEYSYRYEASGDPLTAEFDNGIVHLELGNNGQASIFGIPEGYSYTVTENAESAVGYEPVITNGEGKISAGTPVSVKVSNVKQTGQLIISKSVQPENRADPTVKFCFDVELRNSGETLAGSYDYKVYDSGSSEPSDSGTISGNGQIWLSNGQKAVIEGLLIGTGFTVNETAESAAGYTQTVSGSGYTEADGESGVYTGTISADPAELNFVNTANTGSLSITKIVNDGTPEDDDTPFGFEISFDSEVDTSGLKVLIAGQTGSIENGTITLYNGQTADITGIPVGTTVTVKEKDTAPGRYSTEYLDNYDNTADGIVRISADTPSKVTVTNTRLGDLSITKEVDGGGDENVPFSFELTVESDDLSAEGYSVTYSPDIREGQSDTVTFTGGSAGITLYAGQTAVIDGLPKDAAVTITETGAEKYTAVIEGMTQTGDKTASGTIPAEVKFTNTKQPVPLGTLTVSKVVANGGSQTQDFTFEVELDIPDEYIPSAANAVSAENISDAEEDDPGENTVPPAEGETTPAEGDNSGENTAPPAEGETSPAENNNDPAGMTISMDGTGSEISGTNMTSDETEAAGDGIGAQPENEPDENNGSAYPTVTAAAYTGSAAGLAARLGLDFGSRTVTVSEGTTGEIKLTFMLHSGEQLDISGIPVGTVYAVSEAEYAGYFASTDGETSGTINTEEGARVQYINTYVGGAVTPPDPPKPPTEQFDDIQIRKNVVDKDGNIINDKIEDTFEFTVFIFGDDGLFEYKGDKGSEGSLRTGGHISIKPGETITVYGIKRGATYTVRELIADSSKYDVVGTESVSGTVLENTVISFENVYLPEEEPDKPGIPGETTKPDDPAVPGDTDTPDDPGTPDGEDTGDPTGGDPIDSGAPTDSEEDSLADGPDTEDDEEVSDDEESPDDEETIDNEETGEDGEDDGESDVPDIPGDPGMTADNRKKISEPEDQPNPKTGNNSLRAIILALAVSAAAAFASKKKK